MLLTTRGLVLREVKYKDADKILTVLTESEGKITVSARGVLRRGGRLKAAAQFLCFSEMTLFGSRGRWSMNEAEPEEQFLGLREDIELLALGAYVAELLEAVSDEDCPNPEVLYLGLNTLYALSRKLYTCEHVKAAFELRLMCLAGFEPMVADGGIGGGDVFMELHPTAVKAVRHIVKAEPKRVFSFRMDDVDTDEFYSMSERYVQMRLERSFRTLDYWKKLYE